MDEDENLLKALDGMLDEYMTLDLVKGDTGGKHDDDMLHSQTGELVSESGTSARLLDNVSDDFKAASNKTSPSADQVGGDLSKQKCSTILDGPADIFSSFLSDMVDAHALERCSDHQQISRETTNRIIEDLQRCNLKLRHDFPVVQRDVMKCLNLVDSIRCDMQKTEDSIARTKELLHIDSLPNVPINLLSDISADTL